jgi:uncharacterized protein
MKLVSAFVIALLPVLSLRAQPTIAVGTTVTSVKVLDANDQPKNIPHIGEKVVSVFYTDPDARDVNNPLSEALKAQKFPKDKYAGIGVANCKDTWLPNSAIRMKAREKERQYPGSVILLDDNHLLAKAWGLGSCDDAGVVIIIGKDAKIKFFKPVKSEAESKAIVPTVLKIITDELAR